MCDSLLLLGSCRCQFETDSLMHLFELCCVYHVGSVTFVTRAIATTPWSNNPAPVTGLATMLSPALNGLHQHAVSFYAATSLWISGGATISCWVYLDPLLTPTQVAFGVLPALPLSQAATVGANASFVAWMGNSNPIGIT